MQSPQPDSQVETHLVDLLDFDKFALIKMLVQDRLKVVWCMRLNRAQSDEEHTRIQVNLLHNILLHLKLYLYLSLHAPQGCTVNTCSTQFCARLKLKAAQEAVQKNWSCLCVALLRAAMQCNALGGEALVIPARDWQMLGTP